MTSGAKLFYGIAMFFAAMDVFYILATIYLKDSASLIGLEWAGATGLTMAFLLALMLAAYLHLTDNKTDIGPADWEEAEIEDGAGVLGFFSASSIWPFAMTVAIVLMAYGIAFWHFWLIAFGAVVLIWAGTMLNLQYGLPPEKH
ncbi:MULTISPECIES: aa3-type cytochrome oxidase subunit IV [Corynebacterium]|uniref:Cytochrome c oxidase polypeptide 4 n=1 Tax=Corynebacterium auriscanis TaxID=99807 RepID=A0A0A2DNZ2_9CORY|nr:MULTISPECIES: cytochrome c oxidase subunit 4 [Corynebacterium]KGM19467.1 cytochrome C oxidase [Corynebacterium auriscanis]OFT88457.1 cytochrome-c oxidase [Corynebacterium sp. HMSC28B08]WJY72445.1 Cytochrome c oxidase polypeptide 4 [Corynebacterium auriscanis]